MLKLFFFATILVQGFEIKVENSRVVSFLLCRCRGSLCRDIGWECHIAALLDILAIAITQKRTASNTLSMSAKNFCQMDSSCFFLDFYVGDVKFDTIRACLATALGKSSPAAQYQNYFGKNYFGKIILGKSSPAAQDQNYFCQKIQMGTYAPNPKIQIVQILL